MWIITVRSARGEPLDFPLKPGKNLIGRLSQNDIILRDRSASRSHAVINYDAHVNTVTIRDLDSKNGTYVNRTRLTQSVALKANDTIRIGEYILTLTERQAGSTENAGEVLSGTQVITRDLLLESLDNHTVLLYEVSSRLNNILHLDQALQEVASLLKTALGAERCQVIMADDFMNLTKLDIPSSFARQAIDQRSVVIFKGTTVNSRTGASDTDQTRPTHTALCIPIIAEDEVLALVYMDKNGRAARRFDRRDLQLAIAISHQAALTIQRVRLLDRVRSEQQPPPPILRLHSPQEEAFLRVEVEKTGQLPEMAERPLTILVANISNSAAMAERLDARRLGEILDEFYQEMASAIISNNGIIQKFLGDGVVVVFGLISGADGSASDATRAALGMLRRLEVIAQNTGEDLEMGIGINTGPALSGYLGTPERAELTVLGDTVNLAWGLEALARPNRVLIGPATYAAVQDRFNVRALGRVELKKQVEPITVYEVVND